jgi:carbamoyl-phosphate synthase large subunit
MNNLVLWRNEMAEKTENENIGHSVEEIMGIVERLGGVPIRFTPSFAFGGITLYCDDETSLLEYANEAWQVSPTSEVLVEKLP